MEIKFYNILFVIGLICVSCDTAVVIDLPVNPPKLVVNCLGRNNKPFYAGVSLSQPRLDDFETIPVSNAVLKLYENDKFIESLPFKRIDDSWSSGAIYESNSLFPTPGNTYRLEATAPDIQPVVASYFHPLPVAPQRLQVTFSGKEITEQNPFNIFLKLDFTDLPGENFYHLQIVGKTENVAFPMSSRTYGLYFADPAYEENNSSFSEPLTFDDKFFNGKDVVLEFNASQGVDNQFPIVYFDVYLRTLSKEFYWYLKGSGLQIRNFYDPMAQPVKVENNIKNGLGIFGGYTETVKTFYVPK